MTNIRALNQYENQLAFEMLDGMEFNPDSQARVTNVKLDMNETADDTVMLVGDNIEIDAKEGNNTVYVSGNNNKVSAGDGTNQVAMFGSNSTAVTGSGNDLMYVEGTNITVASTGGDNVFRIYGDGNTALAGAGNNNVGVLGNSNTVVLANGNQTIGYYGNNNQIAMGDGNSSAMTLDHAIKNGQFADMEDAWIKTLTFDTSSERIDGESINDYSYATNAYYAALSEDDLAYANEHDLTEITEDGYAKYIIGTDDYGNAVLLKFAYRNKKHNYYYPIGHEGEVEHRQMIDDVSLEKVAYGNYKYYTIKHYTNYHVDGVSGNTVKFGNGNNTFRQTVKDNTNKVNMGTATTGHILEQQTAYKFSTVEETDDYDFEIIEREIYQAIQQ